VIIVSNTGPLIGLAKGEHLHILPRLAEDVYVPPQVQAELLSKTGPDSSALAEALRTSIKVRIPIVSNAETDNAVKRLDEGERQAIILAQSLSTPNLLLMDDQAGRKAARKLGQPLTGLAGFLLLAKNKGILFKIIPILEMIRAH
jgi:uncharacterized protein